MEFEFVNLYFVIYVSHISLLMLFFFIAKNREVRHQGEAETCQLGWHPTAQCYF